MKFEHRVTAAYWDEDRAKWNVHVQRPDGSDFVDSCDVLINGGGVLK
jgi:cation diffusion facilitator CzcD-associated flavoprotein CzcO